MRVNVATKVEMNRRVRAWALGLVGMVVVAVAVAGCGDFEDVTTIIDVRVLAIKVEPPEVLTTEVVDPTPLYNSGSFSDPSRPSGLSAEAEEMIAKLQSAMTSRPPQDMPSEQLQITALVVDPWGIRSPAEIDAAKPMELSAARQLQLDMYACPNTQDGSGVGVSGSVNTDPCPANIASPVGSMPSDGYPAQPTFAFTPDEELATAALFADPLGIAFSSVPVRLQLDVAAQEGPVEANTSIKRMLYGFKLTDSHTNNTNPTIESVYWYEERMRPTDPATDPKFDDLSAPVRVRLDTKMVFEPEPPTEEAFERYPAVYQDRATQTLAVNRGENGQALYKEVIRYAFYASAGTFSHSERSTTPNIASEDPNDIHLESIYEAPEKFPTHPRTGESMTTVTVWIVARDERGGVGWTQRTIELHE